MLATASMPASAQPGEDMRLVDSFGDWAGGCDNQGRCTMIGWARDGELDSGERPMLLRVEFLHDAPHPTRITVAPQPATSRVLLSRLEYPGPYAFNFTGADARPMLVEERGETLPQATARQLYTQLFVGIPVHAAHPRAPSQRMRFAQDGFGDVLVSLRSIGAAQLRRHRAHRRDQRRAMPVLAATELPVEPVTGVMRLPPVPLNGLCSLLTGVPYQLRRFGLGGGGGRELWQLGCAQRDRNPVNLFYLRDQGAGQGAALMLPTADGSSLVASDGGVPNAGFDFDFGVIRGVRFDGPRDDCGTSWIWGWNGAAFVLLEQREMPRCAGLEPSDWIPVYSRPAQGPDT